MERSSTAVAICFRLLATILLLAMAGRCSLKQMDHIGLSRIAASIENLTQVEQVQAVASGKVASGIMKIFALMASDHLVCEGGWLKLRSSCYFFSEDTRTWEGSRQKCKALNSDLVKINHDGEYNFLRDLVKGHSTYIGLSDLQEEGTFRWVVDGTIYQIDESWWSKGEPNNPEERCVNFYPLQGDRLNDIRCIRELRYICEKPAQLPLELASVLEEYTPADN